MYICRDFSDFVFWKLIRLQKRNMAGSLFLWIRNNIIVLLPEEINDDDYKL